MAQKIDDYYSQIPWSQDTDTSSDQKKKPLVKKKVKVRAKKAEDTPTDSSSKIVFLIKIFLSLVEMRKLSDENLNETLEKKLQKNHDFKL